MNCPHCQTEMKYTRSAGTILKTVGRTIIGGTLGAIGHIPGAIAGAAIGATRKGKNDTYYWKCPKCGYYEYEEE